MSGSRGRLTFVIGVEKSSERRLHRSFYSLFAWRRPESSIKFAFVSFRPLEQVGTGGCWGS
jgi:hypothetical protein